MVGRKKQGRQVAPFLVTGTNSTKIPDYHLTCHLLALEPRASIGPWKVEAKLKHGTLTMKANPFQRVAQDFFPLRRLIFFKWKVLI